MRELGIIQNGAFTFENSRITNVGTTASVEALISPAWDVIDAGGCLVTPGFVDAHTHPVFAGTRADEFELRAEGLTYHDIAARGGGIRSTVRRTRAADERTLLERATRHADWFLRCGTTMVEAKSGYGLTVEDELKILRVIDQLGRTTPLRCVPTFLGAHIVPDEYRDRRKAYVNVIVREMLPRVAAARLAEYCDAFCEEGAFTLEECEQILRAGADLGLKTRLHADQMSSGGGAQLAARLRAVTADHLEHTGSDGIAALRSASVQPVLLPGSVYALGSTRYPAARAMVDAGLAVVLATDFNPGTSPTPSMPMVLSLAVTHMKLTPAEAITAATMNAACSLGRCAAIGSLETGKYADFVIHECEDHRELAYFFGIETATATYVGGRSVFRRHPVIH